MNQFNWYEFAVLACAWTAAFFGIKPVLKKIGEWFDF